MRDSSEAGWDSEGRPPNLPRWGFGGGGIGKRVFQLGWCQCRLQMNRKWCVYRDLQWNFSIYWWRSRLQMNRKCGLYMDFHRFQYFGVVLEPHPDKRKVWVTLWFALYSIYILVVSAGGSGTTQTCKYIVNQSGGGSGSTQTYHNHWKSYCKQRFLYSSVGGFGATQACSIHCKSKHKQHFRFIWGGCGRPNISNSL